MIEAMNWSIDVNTEHSRREERDLVICVGETAKTCRSTGEYEYEWLNFEEVHLKDTFLFIFYFLRQDKADVISKKRSHFAVPLLGGEIAGTKQQGID